MTSSSARSLRIHAAVNIPVSAQLEHHLVGVDRVDQLRESLLLLGVGQLADQELELVVIARRPLAGRQRGAEQLVRLRLDRALLLGRGRLLGDRRPVEIYAFYATTDIPAAMLGAGPAFTRPDP